MKSQSSDVPAGLRTWFVVHFAVDLFFAIPLLLIPESFLSLAGWEIVDPIATRMVGAALLGIGVESLLGRDANREVFRAMLNLKILWASGAVLALGWGLIAGGPAMSVAALAVFLIFLGAWIYYRLTLG
jgi:hypothetical protein